VLPKEYAHPRLDKQRLGQLIDLVGNITLGDEASRAKDILGRCLSYRQILWMSIDQAAFSFSPSTNTTPAIISGIRS